MHPLWDGEVGVQLRGFYGFGVYVGVVELAWIGGKHCSELFVLFVKLLELFCCFWLEICLLSLGISLQDRLFRTHGILLCTFLLSNLLPFFNLYPLLFFFLSISLQLPMLLLMLHSYHNELIVYNFYA